MFYHYFLWCTLYCASISRPYCVWCKVSLQQFFKWKIIFSTKYFARKVTKSSLHHLHVNCVLYLSSMVTQDSFCIFWILHILFETTPFFSGFETIPIKQYSSLLLSLVTYIIKIIIRFHAGLNPITNNLNKNTSLL